ncbi:MAG: MFS transporter [bacterium]|nr:MFS transporter [bacterium]
MTEGMRKFLFIWAGQLVSMTGTAMTRFALITWAYQQTGQATTLALMGFSAFILYVVFSPVAGVLVDRWDRRWVMFAADLASGIMTALILLLYLSGSLEIWHLYIAEALTGAFDAFQLPAYSAAITTLVPKNQLGRVSGMRSLAYTSAQVLAPALAGVVLALFDLPGVLLIDLLTFGAALGTLALVRIPRPEKSSEGDQNSQESFWRQMTFGFHYITARPGLLGLLVIYMGINFAAALTYYGVMDAMVLSRTVGTDPQKTLALASVKSALGAAGVVGGLLLTAWGGPKRRTHGVLAFAAFSFLFGDFIMGIGRTPAAWVFAALVSAFFVPFIVGCDRAIWHSKVAPDVQGRVFGVKFMFQQAVMPLGYLLAGPLADRLFEPALMPGGALEPTFGWLVGSGAGAGMGLMFVCTAFLGCVLSAAGYLFAAVRNVERDLPDYDHVLPGETLEGEVVTTARAEAPA